MFPPLSCPCAWCAILSLVGVHRVLERPVACDGVPGRHPSTLPTIPGEARGQHVLDTMRLRRYGRPGCAALPRRAWRGHPTGFSVRDAKGVGDGRVSGETRRATDGAPEGLYRAGPQRHGGPPRGPQSHGRSYRTLGAAQPGRIVRVAPPGAVWTLGGLRPGRVVHDSARAAASRRRPTPPRAQRAEVRDTYDPSASRPCRDLGTIDADRPPSA